MSDMQTPTKLRQATKILVEVLSAGFLDLTESETKQATKINVGGGVGSNGGALQEWVCMISLLFCCTVHNDDFDDAVDRKCKSILYSHAVAKNSNRKDLM